MKAIVIYFSHDKENYVDGHIQYLEEGNTKKVAYAIQEYLKSDIFEIQSLYDYPAQYDACTKLAKEELETNARPALLERIENIDEYTDIYLGYPSWWATMPMCVWTFLESVNLSKKTIHPFCTHEGSGFGNSIHDLNKLCPNSVIADGLAIRGSRVDNCYQYLKEWLERN